MKINAPLAKIVTHKFINLDEGTTFLYRNNLHIKIKDVTDGEYPFNAICLNDGTLIHCDPYGSVRVVECEVNMRYT